MGTLEKVMQLKQQGQTDYQVVENLKQQGISPREIEEAISQSKIKSILNNEANNQFEKPDQNPNPESLNRGFAGDIPQSYQSQEQETFNQNEQMQPSMMEPPKTQEASQNQNQQPQYNTNNKFTKPIEEPEESQYPSPESQEYYPPEYSEYPQYQEYAPDTGIETINEIAEQVIEEKISKLKKQLDSISGFKEEISLETENINKRLSKIENTMDALQIAILKRIGDYGEDIKNIAKEMHLTQDSFSKMINPLTDNLRELQKITGLKNSKTDSPPGSPEPKQNKPQPKTQTPKKSGPSFEDYLR